MDWKKGNLRAVAILRVSSRRQKDNISYEVQDAEVSEYCRKHGLDLIRVVKIIESAKNSEDRKKYRAEIEFALKNKIRHILFYMSDREARNLTDNETNENLVRRDQIVLHYVRDNKNLHQNSSDSDFMMRDFQALQNKQFSRTLSAKVTDAMRKKAENGWYPGNHPPLGYKNQYLRDEFGRERKRGTILVPDLDTNSKDRVLREFELRAAGFSYAAIRDQVVTEGLVPATKVRSYRANTVEKRLKNPVYYGRFNWEGTEYEGKHELIVPQNLLDKVQASFGQRYSKRIFDDHGVVAGGWMKCAECGCNVIYDPKTKENKKTKEVRTYHYLHCTNGKRVHPTMRGMSVVEEKVWSQFDDAIVSISMKPDVADQVAAALNEAHDRANGTTKKQMESYQVGLVGLEGQEDLIYADLKKGLLDEQGYRRQIDRVREERRHLTKLLEEAQVNLNGAFKETAKSILELATRAKSLWDSRSPRERRDFLDRILSNPRLNGANVEFDLKKPFAVLAEMAKKDDWRSLADSLRNDCFSYAA